VGEPAQREVFAGLAARLVAAVEDRENRQTRVPPDAR
jgi:hypothetical protein